MSAIEGADVGGTSKPSTTINIDNLSSAIASWNSAVTSFTSAAPKASSCSGLTVLESAGLAEGFPAKYDEMLSSLSTFLSSVTSTIDAYCTAAYEADKAVEEDMPEEEGAGDGDENPDTTPTTDDQNTEEENPDDKDDSKDEDKDKDKNKKKPKGGNNNNNNNNDDNNNNAVQLKDNLELQSSALSTMSLNDLSEVSSLLNKLASQNNVTLDELLGNKVYSQQIHDLLANSGSLSEDYRNLIKEGNVDICQTSLKNVFSGKSNSVIGLDDNTSKLMKSYLEDVAKDNNTTYEELFKTEDGKKLIKKSLENFNGVSSYASSYGTDASESLNDVYNSNDGTKYKSIVKKFVDIAKGENSSVEEFALNSNTSSSINNLGKMSLFASNITNFSDDACAEVLSSLFNS